MKDWMHGLAGLTLVAGMGCSPFDASRSSLRASSASKVLANPKNLGLNDLAVLIPLNVRPELLSILPKLLDKPRPEDFASPNFQDPYPGEMFVPREFLDHMLMAPGNGGDKPTMIPVVGRQETGSGSSRIASLADQYSLVSLRLDPCTNKLQIPSTSNADCIPELRLVWQILNTESNLGMHPLNPLDANIHTLYSLTREEFSDILDRLRDLHANAPIDTTNSPLEPHPVIAKEGASGAYLKGILSIVHTYARSSKLSEIAAMRAESSIEWDFMHVSVSNGEFKEFAIPKLESSDGDPEFLQRVQNNESTGDVGFGQTQAKHEFSMPGVRFESFHGISNIPAPEEFGRLMSLKINSRNAVENPTLHNPKNIDCVSCHIADKQTSDYEKAVKFGRLPNNFPSLDTFKTNLYVSEWELTRKYPSTDSVQNFAFIRGNLDSPVITQRVINDTAESLHRIEDLSE